MLLYALLCDFFFFYRKILLHTNNSSQVQTTTIRVKYNKLQHQRQQQVLKAWGLPQPMPQNHEQT